MADNTPIIDTSHKIVPPAPKVEPIVTDPAVGRIDPNTGKHYFSGGTFEEQTKMASSLNDLITSGQYRDIQPDILKNFYSGRTSLEDAIAQVQSTPLYDPSKGRQVDFGKGKIDIGGAPQDTPVSMMDKGPLGGGTPQKEGKVMPDTGEVPYFLWPQGGKAQAGSPAATPAGAPASASPSIPGGYKSPEELQSAVEKVSTDVSGAGVDTRGKSLSEVISESLNPPAEGGGAATGENIPNPALGPAPQFDQYQEEMMLRGNYGVDSMTSQVESIDQQLASIRESEAAQYAKISTDVVSSAVRGKESAQVAATVKGQISALTAQRQLLTKQISDANKMISMTMARDKSDYATAKSQWTKEYNENLKYITAFESGTTPDQKHARATVIGFLNSHDPTQPFTEEEKNSLDRNIIEAYGYEFQGIEEAGLKNLLYGKTIQGSDGKNYLMHLTANPDGSVSVGYTTKSKVTATQYGGLTKGDYSQLEAQFRISPDYVQQVIDSYNSGASSLDDIRAEMRKKEIDPAALDWIMHFYNPIGNAKPGTKSKSATVPNYFKPKPKTP